MGAKAHSATGTMTSMVRKGSNTVESTSGSTFLKNFSTWASTGMQSMMGSTVVA